jgi:3-methyladenine DNA glycosylase Mpg
MGPVDQQVICSSLFATKPDLQNPVSVSNRIGIRKKGGVA